MVEVESDMETVNPRADRAARRVVQADTERPFSSQEDAVTRLIPFHVLYNADETFPPEGTEEWDRKINQKADQLEKKIEITNKKVAGKETKERKRVYASC